MRVDVIKSTDDPEKVACTAARNDYEKRYVGEEEFATVMDEIGRNEMPPEVADAHDEHPVPLQERMWTLVKHLMEHGHYGPFEHPHITFAVKGVSRSLMAQLTRHRHATFDIQSMRYVGFEDVEPEVGEAVVSIPELDDPGLAGRNAEMADHYKEYDDDDLLEARQRQYEAAIKQSFKSYQNLLEMGAAPENARMVLPIGTKVNITFTVNARTLMHIADMRAAADAQWEIREMTESVLDLAEEWMPFAFHYYNENLKNRKNRLAP